MRTTVSLDDDAFRIAREYAKSRSLALGKALSELVRRGYTLPRPTRNVNGLHVFDLPPGSERVPRNRVRELQDEE
jgi:hypothetical protein